MRRLLGIIVGLLLALTGTASATTYPDLSNNDPTYNMAAIKAHGHPAVVLKVNQGVGFLDSTFYYMATAAKHAGLCVGGYDFVQEYTAAEAYTFVNRLHAAGIYRGTSCTLPPTLDVEFGVPSQAGLEHMVAVLVREYGRVQIYTGQWYWAPHFGCWVPPQAHLWLSGYPYASTLCGTRAWQYVVHQYADNAFNGVFSSDMNAWLGSDPGFKAFAQTSPAVAARAVKLRVLYHLYRVRNSERAEILRIRRLLARYRCYPPHRAQRGGRCETWKRQGEAAHRAGDATNRLILHLHSEGV